jgi:DNA integrity scanning protein DisA with diadenylate cyclase activity
MRTRRPLIAIDALASLATALKDIFPGSTTSSLSSAELAAHVEELGPRATLKPKVLPLDERRLAALLYFDQPTPQAGLLIDLRRPVRTSDSHFARSFCRVFNDDLTHVSAAWPLDEHWAALEQTRLRRAVARFLNYRPHKMSNWIRAMEDSMALTYEGRNIRHCLIIARKAGRLIQKLQNRFIPLPGGISIENALLREKWIRTVVDGRRVALLGSMQSGSIIGFISLAEVDRNDAALRYVPHETLVPVRSVLAHATHDIALVVSPQSDLFILSGKGSVFQKSHGHWRVLDYEALHERISTRFREDVVIGVLRAAIDLSYERTGALFCLLDSRDELTDLIPDHGHPLAANTHLRRSLRGQNISIWAQRQVITAAAATDGAVVLDKDGSVLDIACMISSPKEITRLGLREPSMPGSRTLAAWRASFRGVAINVSEDGPITVYERGAEIGRIG